MKKLLAVLLAAVSGTALALDIAIPDPIPLIDEGVLLLVFVSSLAHLGLDLRKFFGMKGSKAGDKGETIDIE
jgi:hypothetical protein